MNNSIYVPERFKRVVSLHLVKTLMKPGISPVPLLLGIHGTPGDGKTYQCEYILRELGAKAFLISGGQLEGSEAGEPAKLLRNTYLNASCCLEKKEYKAAVVLINDIDTGLGNWGDMVQYTINRQTVFGELMHLVDYPTSVEGRTTKRIPIILTGNDFTKLYEPLVRAGRMTAFKWQPTIEEKGQIVFGIFPEISPRECEALVKKFESQPVAFFSHLRASLIDDDLWKSIQNLDGARQAIDQISKGGKLTWQPRIQFERLLEAGQKLVQSGQLINHLRSS